MTIIRPLWAFLAATLLGSAGALPGQVSVVQVDSSYDNFSQIWTYSFNGPWVNTSSARVRIRPYAEAKNVAPGSFLDVRRYTDVMVTGLSAEEQRVSPTPRSPSFE
jgi:hypothetical protein